MHSALILKESELNLPWTHKEKSKKMIDRPKHILIVDDEEPNRETLASMVSCLGYESELARDGIEALAKVKLEIDLVLLDAAMPGMDGFEVARQIRSNPDLDEIPIVMVTGLSGKESRLRAVEAGANDFISKPVDLTELRVRLLSWLKAKEARDALKKNQALLEQTVRRRTADLHQALQAMAEAQRSAYEAHLDTIQRLAVAAEYKDGNTAAHIQRMSHYCALIGRGLDLPPGEMEILRYASPMHDVGKIGIPDAILLKAGKLNPHEWAIMKRHTVIGACILHGSSSRLLQAGESIALSHHEKWDGSGYPYALAGEEIPLYGRICAVADVFDALTTPRPYKEALNNERACEAMRKGRGSHFDPKILDLFFDNLEEARKIQDTYRQESPMDAEDSLPLDATLLEIGA